MKNIIRIITVLILAGSFTFTACKSPSPEEQEVIAVVKENLQTFEKEDFEAHMKTIHEESAIYEQTKNTVKLIMNQYDLKFELEDVEVLELAADEAQVRYVQTTKKIDGPEFKNNRVKGVHTLKKFNGDWKLFSSAIENIEYLD